MFSLVPAVIAGSSIMSLLLFMCSWHISSCDFIVVSVCIGQINFITQAGGGRYPIHYHTSWIIIMGCDYLLILFPHIFKWGQVPPVSPDRNLALIKLVANIQSISFIHQIKLPPIFCPHVYMFMFVAKLLWGKDITNYLILSNNYYFMQQKE